MHGPGLSVGEAAHGFVSFGRGERRIWSVIGRGAGLGKGTWLSSMREHVWRMLSRTICCGPGVVEVNASRRRGHP
ncbi:hypothetical protein BRPE64_ACDS03140 [Caballeronia insecticola]|uniref:Uncharacterized protein n=1 Tax=Caballeronia insecticola TaxID=758793 RepID=R4WEY4_9BURK|nr:hypothetical protein BRPE64_ACDS03140 [Caballeronia insecticola]